MTAAVSSIGIIAAAGALPRLVADAATAQGFNVFIVALRGIADADYQGYRHQEIRVGAFDAILKALKNEGCQQVIMTGKFIRPAMTSVLPDLRASRLLLKLFSSGDNAALEMIRDEFVSEGIEILDIGSFLSHAMASEGVIHGTAPDEKTWASISQGRDLLASLGPFDIGQALVIQGSRVLAIEAAEGTDAMLERCQGLVDTGIGPAVFIKLRKPQQDGRLDPPVIGATTARLAVEAGISVIAVEAGGVLIAEQDEVSSIASAQGLTITGIASA